MNSNKPVSLLLAAALSFVAALPAQAADTLRAGFSTERLARVDALLDSYVNDGRIGGVVALVLRDGKPVYERAVGWSDREAGRKMAMDTEFRIASQSKALTSVAILQLMEEGKLTVNDHAGKYIPTFEHTTVLTRADNSTATSVVAAKRPILIKDLVAVGSEKAVKCEHVRLRIERLRADQLAQDTERLRSTQTHDSDSAPTGRRS